MGDFNYMVYASRTKNLIAKNAKSKDVQIQATLSIFSPHHKGAVYEVSLPTYNADVMERYWIGFCLRGGQGINFSGVSVSDPSALFINKPDVNQKCFLDKERIPTISVPQPSNVNTQAISQDFIDVSWDQPASSGSPVARYRIFVSEKDSTASTYNFETPDAKTSYKLKTPRAMWGRAYLISVQAINRNHKMSLVSEPAVFRVQNATRTSSKAVASQASQQIKNLKALVATTQKITLAWSEVSDAGVYKVKWDKGVKGGDFEELIESPAGTVYLNN